MSTVLRIANLCKSYQITNSLKQDVLKGIDIEMDSGELVGILGESGCGKSTLLHIIGGLDNDYTGSVVIKGKFIRDFSEREMDDYRKKRVGLVFQNYNLISHMTIKENIEIAMQMSDINKSARDERTADLLRLVGLENEGDKMPNQLSGGQKQRVAIARAIANNPSIVLADEPTGALDNDSTIEVIKILKKISELGKLVIVVTHSNKVAEECSRIITLDEGKVISDNIKKEKPKKYFNFRENEPKNIRFKELAKLALKNVLSNKKRNLLVSLGTSIGIAAMILILALSQGLTNYVKDYFNSSTSSTSIISSNSSSVSESKYEDVLDIEGVTSCSKVHTSTSEVECITDEGAISFANLYTYRQQFSKDLLYGSIPVRDTDVMVSSKAASALDSSGMIGAIGKSVEFTYNDVTYEFTICGIYDDEDAKSAYISENAMSNYSSEKNTLYIKIKDITYIDAVSSELEQIGLKSETLSNTASQVLKYIDIGTSALTVVAAISTIVSAIMIIIVMYISVVERTQEIGILRSIGSRKKDVRNIFILEASYLGILGGLFGVVISLLISIITNVVCEITIKHAFISYNPIYHLIGFSISVFVSILSGIAPSNKASSLDPVEALRFE